MNSEVKKPEVVIVGGGFGGLSAAQKLDGKPVKVTLIDRKNHFIFQPLLYQVATAVLSAARLLAANVVSVSDGGGEFFAAKAPVVGREKVALFLANLFKLTAEIEAQQRVVELNGLFGVTAERTNAPEGYAPRVASLFQLDDEGLIERIYFVMASRKLTKIAIAEN